MTLAFIIVSICVMAFVFSVWSKEGVQNLTIKMLFFALMLWGIVVLVKFIQ